MAITKTVNIPPSRRLVIDVPSEVPEGPVILTFTSATAQAAIIADTLPGGSYNSIEKALQAAGEKAADPNRKPISRHFGKHNGIFGGDGTAYQRAIRDEWD